MKRFRLYRDVVWMFVLPVFLMSIVFCVAVRVMGDNDYAPGYEKSSGYVVFDHTGDRVVNGKLSESSRVVDLRTFLDKLESDTNRYEYGGVKDTSKVFGIVFTGESGNLSSRYAVHKETDTWKVYRIGKRMGKMKLKTDVTDREKLDAMVMDVLKGNAKR